ncbi:flagellar filament capping protein FliD [Paenibacillus agricola]|uniref:Flagellar hook-associated protein 2 n=1 Tax=Paenibacillus agricola TaxID=2716264 RepID=A0ABX0JBK3_9BACL|nr:flagellar filament capping protein FliD [Paenibacillus agricola]NHN33892.1 flagellar filament capping protein FliD [Paenibacillus agricola]
MVMRISGLSSGFDTEGTVTKLMQAQRVPYDKLGQKKQTAEWQRDALRDINLKMTEFRNTKLFNFKQESTFNAKTVSITGNLDAVSAKGTASATNTNLKIEVVKLAVAASERSAEKITTPEFDPTKPLASQSENLTKGTLSSGTVTFKINGTQIQFDSSKESLNDVIAKINKDTNVTAFYDSVENKIAFMANNSGKTNGSSGKEANIVFEGALLKTVFQVGGSSPDVDSGIDAEVKINGLTTSRTSNTFTVNGIEVTLKKEGGVAATISTKSDADKIMESVKTFINDYNDVLKTLNDKSTETKNTDYLPLTTEQKEALSEKQIESWESKAKAGLLRNDPILASMTRTLRSSMTAIVDSGSDKYNSLASIGISTGQYYENGKMYIDETKLREAIEANPDAVKAIFTGDATDDSPSKAGVGERLYTQLNSGLTDLTKKAGLANISYDDSQLSKRIYDIDSEMTIKLKRLSTIEDNYYKQFTAMETALNKLNSQGENLLSQLGTS